MPRAPLLVLLLVTACDRKVDVPKPSPSQHAANATTSAPTPSTAPSPAASSSSSAPAASVFDFEGQSVGAPSPSVEAVVGDWYVAEVAGARGLRVDGTKWRHGTPSANLADQAKKLYGDRYAEFLDGVKAFAFFPLAILAAPPPEGDVRVSLRFYPEAGKIDQAAGIAFGIGADGSYFGVRSNALEDNILYFRVVKGKRTIVETIRNVPTPTKTWHTLVVELRGKALRVEQDGKPWLDKTLDVAPTGRIGLWSKADSVVTIDDVKIEPLAK